MPFSADTLFQLTQKTTERNIAVFQDVFIAQVDNAMTIKIILCSPSNSQMLAW